MRIIDEALCKTRKSITIAFIGDSVTQGCFECYKKGDDVLETVYDYKSAYSNRLKEILNLLYPNLQVNIINAGLSGEQASEGYERLYSDVIAYKPNLAIVSYGLNDSCALGIKRIDEYSTALDKMFKLLKENNVKPVFLTENFMCSTVSPKITDKFTITLAEKFSTIQNTGVLDKFFDEAKKVCELNEIAVCDCYSVWKKMQESGVDTTELLANKLNHPIREIHYYIAIKLLETVIEI